MRIYPLTPCHQVCFTSSNSLPEKSSTQKRYYPTSNKTSPLHRVVESQEPYANNNQEQLTLDLQATGATFVVVGQAGKIADISPDSAIVLDVTDLDDKNVGDVKSTGSPLTNIFRISSFSFKRDSIASNEANLTNNRNSRNGKFLNRLRSSTVSLNSANQYGYSPLVGSEENLYHQSNDTILGTSIANIESTQDMAIIPCHVQCSRAADADHQRQTSYWLSSDLLREHTAQLYGCTDDFNKDADTCNVIEMACSLELCDAISGNDKSFPTSQTDLDAVNEKSQSTPSISSAERMLTRPPSNPTESESRSFANEEESTV